MLQDFAVTRSIYSLAVLTCIEHNFKAYFLFVTICLNEKLEKYHFP